jgi:hypothetical protein
MGVEAERASSELFKYVRPLSQGVLVLSGAKQAN